MSGNVDVIDSRDSNVIHRTPEEPPEPFFKDPGELEVRDTGRTLLVRGSYPEGVGDGKTHSFKVYKEDAEEMARAILEHLEDDPHTEGEA